MNLSTLFRSLGAILGAIIAELNPILPTVWICSALVLWDCYTAWCLARRVRKKYPDKTTENTAKFKSANLGRALHTLLKVWILIILAYFITIYICQDSFDLTRMAAGAVCMWQGWSILENELSCRDSGSNADTVLKILRKVVVDKTSRHFDVDLSELLKDKDDGKD